MTRVVDDAGILSAAEAAALARIGADQPVELILLTVRAVARRAFRQHAVSVRRQLSQAHDRSVLVVLAVDDRHVEVATAARYAGRLDGAATAALLAAHAVPLLRAGRTAEALAATLDAIAARLAGPLPEQPRPPATAPSHWFGWILLLALAGAVLAAVLQSVGILPRGGGSGDTSSWSDSGSDSNSSDSGSSDSGGSSDGGGGADF